jgi:hypothetical protein
MRIALIQGNYFPWIGYFALMNNVDLFLVYEDVQYTKNDFRNRNWINVPYKHSVTGKVWLTVPVRHESATQRYRDVKLTEVAWPRKHLTSIRQCLSKNPRWPKISSSIEALFEVFRSMNYLYEVNRLALEFCKAELQIATPIKYIQTFDYKKTPSERVAEIVKSNGGNVYLSGPSAKGYLDPTHFHDRNLSLEWCNYVEQITLFTGSEACARKALANPQSILHELTNGIDNLVL